MGKPKKKAASGVDWDRGDRMIRAGQLSLREIGVAIGCCESAVRKRIKTRGLVRDLTPQVRSTVRSLLVRKGERTSALAKDAEIIQEAAETGAEVVRTHRKDILALRRVEQALLAELGDAENPPKKVYVTQYQGQIIEREFAITVTERATALNALAGASQKRIQLERQAYNLDEDGADDAELPKIIERTIVHPGDADARKSE